MNKIKKTSIRFNLENEQDKEIWEAIQQKTEKKKNTYIKFLVYAGLHQEEQQKILDELLELKKMLIQGNITLHSNEKIEKVMDAKVLEQQEPQNKEVGEGQTEVVKIDAEVMNFLDNL